MARAWPLHNHGHEKNKEQAGAELCQAQDKLGLAKPSLPSKK